MRFRCLLAFLLGLMLSLPAFADDGKERYFEEKIRPLLAKHCFECHGDSKQEAELRLDLKKAFFHGDGGPLAVAGDLEGSRIWQVVRYDQLDTQMPPQGKLPDEDLGALKQWIMDGAFWPDPPEGGDEEHNGEGDGITSTLASHWSYQPIEDAPVPAVSMEAGCQTSLDAFVAQRIEEAGLRWGDPADRETLIRRLSFDLHGIPPAYGDVVEFVQDERPDAWERLVDRFLASPLYGQRWGRYWLDVARYADTKGYVFTQNRLYPYAYTYRNYVIQSLNDDTAYDRFIVEQLAADQLNLAENDPRLAAMGFLTIGSRFLNNVNDMIDDRIDVVTRGLLGMTMACSRCHDHKYDPIPTADYYSLYGVFNSSEEPEELPLIGKIDESDPGYQAFLAERQKREQSREDYITKSHRELFQNAVDQAVDYVPEAAKQAGLLPAEIVLTPQHGPPRQKTIAHWRHFLDARANEDHPIFLPWKVLMAIPEAEWNEKLPAALEQLQADDRIPAVIKSLLVETPLESRVDLAGRYGTLIANVSAERTKLSQQDPPVDVLPDADREAIKLVFFGPSSFSDSPISENSALFEEDQRIQIRNLQASVDEWTATSPNTPARAMLLKDRSAPIEPVIFLRGNVGRHGPHVPRKSPLILQDVNAEPYQQGSGRLELAQDIISNRNPLTARVIVNRVWSRHFGVGLSPTTSDFGTRGETPSHPELLDHLAWTFMHEEGWSLKALHRRILISHVYQQTSTNQDIAAEIDPENRFLWRQNRQRLDFEAMRDSYLAVSGMLQLDLDGRSANLEAEPYVSRRAVYGFIDRNNPSGLLRTFDFPTPDTSSPSRPQTIVPQQALFMLNSPFVQTVSRSLAEHAGGGDDDRRAQAKRLVVQVFSRDPTEAEIDQIARYLQDHPLHEAGQALLMTNEFLYVD